jgi:pimeloyl-ACP methyl ester carboxylesterase
MRGHGRTDSPADPAAYSEAATVADMSAILDAVGVQRAIIGGHSLGGYMSLAFHRDHRARVSALLLCGTGPGYRKDDARAAWNKIAVQFGEHIEKQGLSASGHSAEMRLTDHKSVHGLVCAARGMLTQRDASVLNTLPDINAPTFMSVGSDDKSYLDGMRYMAGKIAGAELHVFEGAGHAANIDQPQAFNAKLEAFLAKRSG